MTTTYDSLNDWNARMVAWKPVFDWVRLGRAARQAAMDAHDGELPHVSIAWEFLLDNPDCFIGETELDAMNKSPEMGGAAGYLTMADVETGNVGWPEEMPRDPGIEFIAAYYGAL